jgi:predicted dehydrogenase
MGRVHSRAYRAVPVAYPELEVRPRLLVAADTSAERRDYARDVLGYTAVTADWRDVLADPAVEVVSICAPNYLHAQTAIAAAHAGRSFWIEKPAGRSAAETEAIAQAAAAAGVTTTVGFNYRLAPAVEHARQLVVDGALGRVTNVRGAFFADYSSDPDGALTWRFVRSLAGSGVLGDLMGHLVDLVRHVVGPVTDVCALTSTVYDERPEPPQGAASHFAVAAGGPRRHVENEDYAAMLVRFAGGAAGTLEASRVAIGRRASYGLEVYGTQGSLGWNFERMNELDVALRSQGEHVGFTPVMAAPGWGDFGRFQPGAGTSMGYDDLKVIEAARFLAAVVGGPAQGSTIGDAVAANRVLDAAERSATSGAWQAVAAAAGSVAANQGARA